MKLSVKKVLEKSYIELTIILSIIGGLVAAIPIFIFSNLDEAIIYFVIGFVVIFLLTRIKIEIFKHYIKK